MSFVDSASDISTGPSPDFPAAPSNPSTFGGLSTSQLLSGGALAGGGAGLGFMLSQGPAPLPSEYGQLLGNVPGLESEAFALEGEGSALTAQGTSALAMGANGTLTAPQQAQLQQYDQQLTNQSDQMFASMGRNPNQDTSAISSQADIDAKVNAMAQQDIQSTIALGLGEISAGSSASGQALGFENAANSALIAAGQAQVAADTAYSQSLTSAFTAIGTMAGTVIGGVGGAVVGGPAGAIAGASVGGAAGGAAGKLA
jgi:hypothetical protein